MPNYIRIKQINQNELSGFVEGSLGESVALVTATQNIVSGIFESYNDVSGNFVLRSGDQTISGVKAFKTGSFDLLTINGQTNDGDYSARINFVDSNYGSIDVSQDGNFKLRSSAGIFNINTSAGQITAGGLSTYELGQTLSVYRNINYDYVGVNWFNKSITFADSLNNEGINYSNTIYYFKSGVSGYIPIDSEVVHNTGDETISGIKTFKTRPTVNGTGVLLSGEAAALPTTIVYTTGNQIISGIKTFAEGVDLNNIDNLNLSGVDVTITSGIVALTNRPTVNGTGVLLVGEVTALPTTIVYTTGLQNVSGSKTFLNTTIFKQDIILSGAAPISNPNVTFGLEMSNGIYFDNFYKSPYIKYYAGYDNTLEIRNPGGSPGMLKLINGPKPEGNEPQYGQKIILDGDLGEISYEASNHYFNGDISFSTKPTVNGTGVLLSGEVETFKFTGDLNVSLTNNKTFGRYSNGQTIPASGKTLPEFFNLVLVEPISPTVSLTSNTVIPFNQTSINNILNASNTINSLNSSIQTGYIEYRRGNVGSYINLTGNQSSSIVYTHSLTDTSFNTNPFNYRYVVTDTVGGTNTSTLTITPSFFYRNYLGYSPNTTLTFSQLEALSNSVLSDSKSRTISSVTAGAGNYTYYCYRASQGDLSSILQDSAYQVLGSFTKLTDVVGVNTNGVSVTYRVYKSNYTDAFTNTSLAFN